MPPLDTVQRAFLSTFMGSVPVKTKDAIRDIKAKYPTAVVTACVADTSLLRIGGTPHKTEKHSVQGGIDLHPKTFEGLAPDRQKKLIDGLNHPDPAERQKVIDDFEATKNERWRFDDTYQKTVSELETVPGDLSGLQPILNKASPAGKHRLAQIQISHGLEEERAINTRGVELAIQMGATDCSEVVAYVEFFYAYIEPENRRLKKLVETEEKQRVQSERNKGNTTPDPTKDEKKKLVSAKLLDFMGKDTLDPARLSEAKKTIDEYKTAMTPYCGAAITVTNLDTAADETTAVGLIKGAAGGLLFGDTTNGGYHLFKHFDKMYSAMKAFTLPDKALHYTTEARDTVATCASASSSAGQTGSVSYAFVKGKFKTFVPVSGNTAGLASFF